MDFAVTLLRNDSGDALAQCRKRFSKTKETNVRSPELLSKEWCDVVFEGRNRDYGAYQIRRRTGRRYRLALGMVVGAFLAVTLLYAGLTLYARYTLARDMDAAADALSRYKPSELKEGYEVKFVATARLAPSVRMAPGAKQGVPKIVEGQPLPETIGTDGPIAYDPEEQVVVTPIVDTTGIHDPTLPIAKQKIVPTEQVSQMPDFPGGLRAFMNWLNEHVSYPQTCIDRKQAGTVTLSFIVGKDGYATDVEVKNAFDKEIFRSANAALKKMPRWKPGTNENGEPTPVKITIPIEFKL